MKRVPRKPPFLDTRALIVYGLLLFTNIAQADQRLDSATGSCRNIDDCLNVLYDWSRTYNGSIVDVTVAVASLKRFGDPMRRALLDRATGKDRKLRQLSDLLLNTWHDWSPGDVPALARVLSANPGGMVARSLGEIGTPEAMRALADDMRREEGQSVHVLEHLGARAIPYLLPLLVDARSAARAARVITAMGDASRPFAESWARLAADPRQSTKVRVAGLRGLAALGKPARQWTGEIHILLASHDETLRAAAADALLAAGDPAVLDSVLKRCHPKGNELEFLEPASTDCLRDIESLGHDARSAGPKLTAFLDSPNADERLSVVTAFGAIGYSNAIPRLRAALKDIDWRVVYAAAKSLGELRAAEAAEDLQRIADTFWLPEVRRQARYSLDHLKLPADLPIPTAPWEADVNRRSGGFPYDFYHFVLDDIPVCFSQEWRLQSFVFDLPEQSSSRAPRTVLARLDGSHGILSGSNRGEFGGDIKWKPDGGPSKLLYKGYDVTGIFPDGAGAIAVIGMSHIFIDFSIVVSVDPSPAGRWTLHEMARLPGASSDVIQVSPGVYAARSGHRVTVFNRTQILGLADCSEAFALEPAQTARDGS